MAKHALYVPTQGWKTSDLPLPFTNMGSGNNPDFFSEFHSPAKQTVTPHAYTIKAALVHIAAESSKIGLVCFAEGAYATEVELSTGETALFAIYPNGQCKGAIRSNAGRHEPIKPMGKTDAFDTTFIFLALLQKLSELSPKVSDVLATARTNGLTLDNAYYLSDALEGALNDGKLKATMPGGNIDLLTAQTIESGALSGTVLCGKPKILRLNRGKLNNSTGVMQFSDAMAEFADWRKRRTWTEEEKLLIPTFPDDYPVMPETMKICRRYVGTHEDKRPMLNFMWRGITSYGKSTGVELMAALLNMPLLRLTCHTTMETQDFLSNIVPVSKAEEIGGLPTFNEIACDPESAYLAITGEEKEDVTPEECLAAYGEACAARASKGSGSLFKQVESNFVRALERGYLLEVQECSRIKDPGVLVGLNEYDRPGALIPLVDGRFVRRHEDAMVIYTDNVGYASCRSIDPSVLRRMAIIIDSNTIPEDVALSRVIYNTGFADEGMLKKMYDVWEEIRTFCADRDMTEGSISLSELERWAQCVMADGYGSLKENCEECVVSKATSIPEEQADIISSVLAVHLS